MKTRFWRFSNSRPPRDQTPRHKGKDEIKTDRGMRFTVTQIY